MFDFLYNTVTLDIASLVVVGVIAFTSGFHRGVANKKAKQALAAYYEREAMDDAAEAKEIADEQIQRDLWEMWIYDWSDRNDQHLEKLVQKAFTADRIGRENVFNVMMEMKNELGIKEPLHQLVQTQ